MKQAIKRFLQRYKLNLLGELILLLILGLFVYICMLFKL